MAARAQDGVINEVLETYEIPGLYVVDGSIFLVTGREPSNDNYGVRDDDG